MDTKNCSSSDCDEINPQILQNFHKKTNTRDGLNSQCKSCISKYNKMRWKVDPKHRERIYSYRDKNKNFKKYQRDYNLEKLYGITQAEYEALLARQNGGCAVCGEFIPHRGPHMPIDHDHETGLVRGIVCNKHNRGIGLFNDNPDLLRSAAEYLENFKLMARNERELITNG